MLDLDTLLTTLTQSGGDLILDSKTLKSGDIFVALQGRQSHGLNYLDEAINKGALAVISNKKPAKSYSIPLLVMPDLATKLAVLATKRYGKNHPLVVAVTGTNGKTSVVHFLLQLFAKLNKPAISVGSLGVLQNLPPNQLYQPTLTTPDIFSLYQLLSQVAQTRTVFLEASSHALAQDRLSGIIIDSAIWTNLSQDHLDYHSTMDDYFIAKAQLFRRKCLKLAIINADDPYSKKLLTQTQASAKVSYGLQLPMLFTDIKADKKGFNLYFGGFKTRVNLLGKFNLYNLLAAISYVKTIGISNNKIAELLPSITPPPGRLQQIQNYPIWVDFAHTPDALSQVLLTIKEHYEDTKIVLILGCGGNRDQNKRSQMGIIADKLADEIILTNDNPRDENPMQIINQIKSGIHNTNVEVITDRKAAIEYAIDRLESNNCLLVVGKGSETTQTIGNQKLAFNDVQVIQTHLHRLDFVEFLA